MQTGVHVSPVARELSWRPAGKRERAAADTEHLLWAPSCEPLPRPRGGGGPLYAACVYGSLLWKITPPARLPQPRSRCESLECARCPLAVLSVWLPRAVRPPLGTRSIPVCSSGWRGGQGSRAQAAWYPSLCVRPRGGSVLKLTSDPPGGCKG